VVVYKDLDALRMHRLVETTVDDNGNTLFISKGDSRLENDKPWTRQQFLGVALKYKNGERAHSIKVFVLPAWRNKLNFRLVWVVGIVRKIMKKFNGLMA
jgi:hypothetical protein